MFEEPATEELLHIPKLKDAQAISAQYLFEIQVQENHSVQGPQCYCHPNISGAEKQVLQRNGQLGHA